MPTSTPTPTPTPTATPTPPAVTISVLDSEGDVGIYTSIAIGADGLALISYHDLTTGSLKVAHCANLKCTSATITTLDEGYHTSIAVGADGLGLIGYYDIDNGNLKVAHCSNVECTSATVTTLDTGAHPPPDDSPEYADNVGVDPSITIGSDGLALISYFNIRAGDLKVAHCSNIACTAATVTTLDSHRYVGRDTSITIGADSLGLISYWDNSTDDLKVAHCSNIECTSATYATLDSGGNVGMDTSIAIGADGRGLISYHRHRSANDSELKVAHCLNLECSSASIATLDSGDRIGNNASIVIGTDGLGLISYYDGANTALKVAHCSNVECSSAEVHTPRPDEQGGGSTSIAIGADGLALISHYDMVNGDLKVTHCLNESCAPEPTAARSPPPVRVDITGPTLISAGVSPRAAGPGTEIVFTVTAEQDPSALRSATIYYERPVLSTGSGNFVIWKCNFEAQATCSGVKTVGVDKDLLLGGTYTFVKLVISDLVGNETWYLVDGTVYADGWPANSTHAFLMPILVLEGVSLEPKGPTLTGVAISSSQVAPGTEIVSSVSAEDAAGLIAAHIYYDNGTPSRRVVWSCFFHTWTACSAYRTAGGSLQLQPGSTLTFRKLVLHGAYYAESVYHSDGTVTGDGWPVGSTHDFTLPDLVGVESRGTPSPTPPPPPSLLDVTGPTLSSAVISPTDGGWGTPVVFDVTAEQDPSRLGAALLYYVDPAGRRVVWWCDFDSLATCSGAKTAGVDRSLRSSGTYTFDRLLVYDKAFNRSWYHADGTVMGDGWPEGSTHGLAMPSLMLNLVPPTATSSPVSISVLDSKGVVGAFTSIATGADGLALISYWDSRNTALKIAHCSDVECSKARLATLDSEGWVGPLASITIGSDGLALISYRDKTNYALKVAHCSNTECSRASITTLDTRGPAGWKSSIAIGADGLGLITYYDQTNFDLRVAHCSNVECSDATYATLDSAGKVGTHNSITIGADGLGLISYWDGTNSALKVAHCSNVECSSATITTLDGFRATGHTSITIGADGLGLISYHYSNFTLMVAHCTNIECTNATTVALDIDGDVGKWNSITIGGDGLGLISYYDRTNGNLKVVHCSNVECSAAVTRTLDARGDVGRYTSITIGGDGMPLISYYDEDNGYLKVAHCSAPDCQ